MKEQLGIVFSNRTQTLFKLNEYKKALPDARIAVEIMLNVQELGLFSDLSRLVKV
jgi:hypothetical protein